MTFSETSASSVFPTHLDGLADVVSPNGISPSGVSPKVISPNGVSPNVISPKVPTRLLFCPEQIEQLRFLAEMSYPFEACGVLVGRKVGSEISVLQIFQTRNLGERHLGKNGALGRYTVDPEEFLAAEREAREQGLAVVGIWHSHPNHSAEPSAADREQAWADTSYVIVSVDALGKTVVRSWRRQGDGMVEEIIEKHRAV